MAIHFQIPPERIYTELGIQCGASPYIPQIKVSQVFNQPSSKSLYPYMFYITPDYNIDNDRTNLQVREKMADK